MKAKQVSAIIAFVAALAITSCSTPKDVAYMQDLTQGPINLSQFDGTVRAQPGDQLYLVVSSKDPALAALFNLPIQSTRVGDTKMSSALDVLYYTVNEAGNIDIPVLGEVHVAGLTQSGIALEVKNLLKERNLIKDPTVTVDFINQSYSVIGEVAKPGRFNIKRNKVTLLEALAEAGDLTIQGERTNVAVIREDADGKQTLYRVDLTKANDLYSSPVYYLQQNDVVYVEPNDYRKRQRQANGNTVLTASFWLSVASFLTTIAVLIFK